MLAFEFNTITVPTHNGHEYRNPGPTAIRSDHICQAKQRKMHRKCDSAQKKHTANQNTTNKYDHYQLISRLFFLGVWALLSFVRCIDALRAVFVWLPLLFSCHFWLVKRLAEPTKKSVALPACAARSSCGTFYDRRSVVHVCVVSSFMKKKKNTTKTKFHTKCRRCSGNTNFDGIAHENLDICCDQNRNVRSNWSIGMRF